MKLDAVLFDVDGTLIDSVDQHARAWADTFAYLGIYAPYAAVRAQIGKGGDNLMPVFVAPDRLERIREALEEYRSALFKRAYLPTIRPLPGVRDLFVRLRRDGRRVALASSGKQWEVEHHMRLLKIEQLVDAYTTADSVEHSKPYPDIFAAAAASVGTAPDRALAVGDSPWDALAATRAGVKTVGVRTGGFADETLRSAGVIAIHDGPAALLADYDRSPFAR
jgi:HAD superfamily hydrolase (TIGR01549 family)